MDHLSFSSYPEGQVKARMKLAPGALAARLSTGALHGDEAPTEEGLFMKDLSEPGAGPSFWIGQMASGTHRDHLLLSDILYYIRFYALVKYFFECEFARVGRMRSNYGIHRRGAKKKNRFAEFLYRKC
jgi:hypothetical protein